MQISLLAVLAAKVNVVVKRITLACTSFGVRILKLGYVDP